LSATDAKSQYQSTDYYFSISYRQVKTVFVQKADMFPLVSLTTLHERMICEIQEHVIQFWDMLHC
jgi:hypothetical protein